MIRLALDQVAEIVGGTLRPGAGDAAGVATAAAANTSPAGTAGANDSNGAWPDVEAIAIDTRRMTPQSLFVALPGRLVDGHAYLAQAATGGAAAALVAAGTPAVAGLPSIAVASPLAALQRLAAWYRRAHLGTVVAITGSNGKTVVKDALYNQLAGTFQVAASPGSFNSQLGVPLAVLAAPPGTPLAVFEAGISAPGEMATLADILAPDCGILTNVGLAHIAAFTGREQLAREKLSLFAAIGGWLLLPGGDPEIAAQAARLACRLVPYPDDPLLPRLAGRLPDGAGSTDGADPAAPPNGAAHLTPAGGPAGGGLSERLEILFPSGARHRVRVRTRSAEIVDDLMMAIGAAHLLGVSDDHIVASLQDYAPPPTRLEVWRSPSGITLVNDLVSADPISVRAALRTTSELSRPDRRKLFVFGGMRELGQRAAAEYAAVGALAGEYRFDTLLLVEPQAPAALPSAGEMEPTRQAYLEAYPQGEALAVDSVAAVRQELRRRLAPGDTLLLKGPRHSGIDAAALDLVDAMAPNRLIVDLAAVAGNIAAFRRACGPRTRIMAMVKAVAYGSDLVRLSSWLSEAGIEHLGVSTADEGAELRRAGIRLPILVTLPTAEEAEKLARFDLTPALYSFALVAPLAAAARALRPADLPLTIHLKLDTGMHRVGVAPDQAVPLARAAVAAGLRVTGVMTHLASADDPSADDDTRRQLARFDTARAALAAAGFHDLLTHAAATAAAARFPQARYDMVRLGLGLYGLYPSPAVAQALPLQLAVTLLSRIAEVRTLTRGDRVGYNGTYLVDRDHVRAGILPLGYHDGIPWSLSNRGAALVAGHPAPILGRISMDSLVVDLTNAPAATAGEEALLFGTHHGALLRPEAVAATAGTIPYELLARLGPRIQRVYVGF
jgi:Alr-MurF fusion protein